MPASPSAAQMSENADRLPPAATVLYRPDADLLSALLTPLKHGGRRLFIFVNGAVDPSIDRLLAELPNVRIERSDQNVGLGAGLNAVVGAASEEGFRHILLLDQDSTPDESLGEALMARFRALDRPSQPLAGLGPLLLPPADGGYLPIRYWRRPPADSQPEGAVDFLPTSGSLVSIAAWRQVGPFRADYFIGGIDVEWGFRCWAKGFASAVAGDIIMAHRWGHGGGRSGAGGAQILRESDLRIFYYVRNALDGLRLAHMPIRWKSRQVAILVAQLPLLLISRRFASLSLRVVARAMRDGWVGRLGPAPDDLFARE